MISGWYKARPDTWVTGYWEPDGGCCDNDVHEIFKCLEETVMTNAFVLEQDDGGFKGYNCTVHVTGNRLDITPYENVLENIHFNTKRNVEALIHFKGKELKTQITGGDLKWVRK